MAWTLPASECTNDLGNMPWSLDTDRLSLARPGVWSVRRPSGRGRAGICLDQAIRGVGRRARVDRRDLEPCHVDRGLCGRVAPLAPPGPGLLVRDDVEGDEEDEVGAEDDAAGDGGELLASTAAVVRHPLPIRGGEVGVGGKVHEAWMTLDRGGPGLVVVAYRDR